MAAEGETEPFFMVTQANLARLAGAGPLAMATYMVLLSRMDIRTGLVGAKTGISRQMLREHTERVVARGKGFQTLFSATDKEIRGVLAELVDRGLMSREGIDDVLVFRMTGVQTGKVRPNQTGPDSGPNTGPGGKAAKAKDQQGFDAGGQGDTGPGSGPNTGPSSRELPLSIERSSQSEPSVKEEPDEMTRALALLDGLADPPATPQGYGVALQRLGYVASAVAREECEKVLRQLHEAAVSLNDVARGFVIAQAKGSKPALYAAKAMLTVWQDRQRALAASPQSAGSAKVIPMVRGEWFMTWSGIEAKAAELGVVQGKDEYADAFKIRVLKVAGVTRQQLRVAEVDAQVRR
jgi:hypothetical protein